MNSAVNIILYIAIHFFPTAEKVLASEKLQIYLKSINYTLVILMKICIIMLDYYKNITVPVFFALYMYLHIHTTFFYVRYMYFNARNYKH